jgi:hypothetical protein
LLSPPPPLVVLVEVGVPPDDAVIGPGPLVDVATDPVAAPEPVVDTSWRDAGEHAAGTANSIKPAIPTSQERVIGTLPLS